MEGRDVLQHLLQVEKEALSLSADAAAEADRRVAGREGAARERYSARYEQRVAELDAAYEAEAVSIAAEYRRQLDAYRTSLDSAGADQQRFAAAVLEFLSLES